MRPITQEKRELYVGLALMLLHLKAISPTEYVTVYLHLSMRVSDIIIT